MSILTILQDKISSEDQKYFFNHLPPYEQEFLEKQPMRRILEEAPSPEEVATRLHTFREIFRKYPPVVYLHFTEIPYETFFEQGVLNPAKAIEIAQANQQTSDLPSKSILTILQDKISSEDQKYFFNHLSPSYQEFLKKQPMRRILEEASSPEEVATRLHTFREIFWKYPPIVYLHFIEIPYETFFEQGVLNPAKAIEIAQTNQLASDLVRTAIRTSLRRALPDEMGHTQGSAQRSYISTEEDQQILQAPRSVAGLARIISPRATATTVFCGDAQRTMSEEQDAETTHKVNTKTRRHSL